jgi:hypothetical protein
MKDLICKIIDEALYRGIDPKILRLDIKSLELLEKDMGFDPNDKSYTIEQFLGLKIKVDQNEWTNKIVIEIE